MPHDRCHFHLSGLVVRACIACLFVTLIRFEVSHLYDTSRRRNVTDDRVRLVAITLEPQREGPRPIFPLRWSTSQHAFHEKWAGRLDRESNGNRR